MICVLIFFINIYIVGNHLNYLDKFIKAYVVGTHLNCLDFFEAIQMSTHNICYYIILLYYKEVDNITHTAI